jgi:hypothetical protein
VADLAERVERGCVAAGPGQGDHEGGPGALVQRLALGQPFQVRQVVVSTPGRWLLPPWSCLDREDWQRIADLLTTYADRSGLAAGPG